MKRPRSSKTSRAAAMIGEHLTTWRKLHGLTADQVCQRAAISRPTLRKVEHGDPTVSFEAVLNVAKSLG
jgi:transcriptional regulator with XRE-family HTH domain